MNDSLDGWQLVDAVRAMADALDAQRDYLSSLDSTIGDGDHGANIARAFRQAALRVAQLELPSPERVLRVAGETIQDSMGGASGLLFGTFFVAASGVMAGQESLTLHDMADMFDAGLTQVQRRGKAKPGDKTMVDALAPAVQALQAANAEGIELDEGLCRAAAAAMQGAQSTRDMVARQGRAKYLGERSRGFQDAGATSVAILLAALAEARVTQEK